MLSKDQMDELLSDIREIKSLAENLRQQSEALLAENIRLKAAGTALKQKEEVVWEGKGRVGSIDMYKVIYPEGLYRDDVPPNGEYHVTISLPQQEQE